MAEQVNPTQGTEQAPSLDTRLDRFITRYDAEEAEGDQPESGQSTEGQARPLLTPDDLPDVQGADGQQAVDEAFEEIEWQGQKHRLTRAEVIKHAQQGFDYTQKTMLLAEQARGVNERMQRLAAVEQVQPHLQMAQGQIVALQQQLAPYSQVDWVRWATEDPLEYSKARAQYDTLVGRFQGAVGQYQQINNAVEQQRAAIGQHMLQSEAAQLVNRIPEWKDPARYKSEAGELRKYLISEGASPQDVDSLTSSVAVAVARKAMLYDNLLKSKYGKVKQLREAPPMSRPGAAQSGNRSDRTEKLTARLKKTGSLDDAAALLLNRMK